MTPTEELKQAHEDLVKAVAVLIPAVNLIELERGIADARITELETECHNLKEHPKAKPSVTGSKKVAKPAGKKMAKRPDETPGKSIKMVKKQTGKKPLKMAVSPTLAKKFNKR